MSDFYNWNRIKVRYCDESSFTGDGSSESSKFCKILSNYRKKYIYRKSLVISLICTEFSYCLLSDKVLTQLPVNEVTKLRHRWAKIFTAVIEDLLAKEMKMLEMYERLFIYQLPPSFSFSWLIFFIHSRELASCN